MADNIGTIYIPAPVLQLKDTQFIQDGVIVPQYLEVPCRSQFIDLYQYWAVPTKDNGIFTGLWMQPAFTETNQAIAQPSYDSFKVLRIRDKDSDYSWYLMCTLTQYTAACNTCCGSAFTPIPFPTVPVIAPCEILCDAINTDGNYFVVFAAPPEGDNYIINGSYDNEQIAQFTATTLDNLVTQLNTHFGTIASPATTIVWTRSGITIIGTVQGGLGLGISLCLKINSGDTSP